MHISQLKSYCKKGINFFLSHPVKLVLSASGVFFLLLTTTVLARQTTLDGAWARAASGTLLGNLVASTMNFPVGTTTVRCQDGGKINFIRTKIGKTNDPYSGSIICDQPSSTPAPTPTPTATPVPTVAPTPGTSPTPTPTTGSGITYCSDADPAKHDYMRWHSAFDTARNCYYDHEHGDNPAELDGIFGQLGSIYGSASMPLHIGWHTSENENKMNVMTTTNGVTYDLGKHGGMKVSTYANIPNPCQQDAYSWVKNDSRFNARPLSCVTDIRILHHWKGDADFGSRFHSVWREMRVCAPKGDGTADQTKCGIVRSGGWSDYGVFHCPYKSDKCPLPGIDPVELSASYDLNLDPYRAIDNQQLGNSFLNNASPWAMGKTAAWGGSDNKGVITSCNPFSSHSWCKNTVTSHKFFVYDIPFALDKNKLLAPLNGQDMASRYRESLTLICPDGTCRFNNTEFSLFEAISATPDSLDATDGKTDGLVTYSGWTDRYGKIVTGCTTAGLDCVPLRYEHVPVGYAVWSSQPGISGAELPRKNHDVLQEGIWPINPARN